MNAPPSIVYADQFADAAGVQIRFTLADAESDPCVVDIDFREDTPPGSTTPSVWTSISPLTGSLPTSAISSPHGTYNVVTWDTKTQFAGRRSYPNVFVRITPHDPHQAGQSYQLLGPFVPNDRVQVWDVEPGSGQPLTISYRLKDVESDVCSIQPLYSIDQGSTWLPATPAAGAAVSGLASSPAGVTQTFEWDVLTDLGGRAHPLVIFKIVPFDVATGVEEVSRPIVLNFPPTCTVVSVTPADPTIVVFDLHDQEGDICTVTVRYSLDNGGTWTKASEAAPGGATRHLLSKPPGNRHAFAWDTRHDIGSIDATGVLIDIKPTDLEDGTPIRSQSFDVHLAPNAAPAVTVGTIQPAAYNAPTVIGVDVADAEGDPVWIALEYSLDAGANWHPATVQAPSLAAPVATSAAWTHYDLGWDAWADLGERLSTGVLVQVLVQDPQHLVSTASSSFDIDTRPTTAPEIRNAVLDATARYGPVVVAFDLVEAESRDCTITVEVSVNSGGTWTPASTHWSSALPPLDARPASPSGVHQYFSWDAYSDLGSAASVKLRLTPSTTRQGTSVPFDFDRASLPAASAPAPTITSQVATQAAAGEPVLVSFKAVDRSCRAVLVDVAYVDAAGAVHHATDLGAPNGGSLAGLIGCPDGTPAAFTWNAATDLNGVGGTYLLRLTPRASGSSGTAVDTASLTVDASPLQQHAPNPATLAIRPADRDGVVEARFTLIDVESDRCDITAEYQDPSTGAWKAAAMLGITTQLPSSPAGDAASARWNALADLGPGTFAGMRVQVTANDGHASQTVPSQPFDVRVLPAHPRALAGTALSVTSADRRQPVLLAFDVVDTAYEYASTEIRFSLMGASDWRVATLAGEWLMQSVPGGSSRGLRWSVSSDLPAGQYRHLRLEATPIDTLGRRGPSVRTPAIALDVWPLEAQPPVVTSVQLAPGIAGDPVAIQIAMRDFENLMCDLAIDVSTTAGVNWEPATLVDAHSSRGIAVNAGGTAVTLSWDVRADLADGHWPDVRVRVTPSNPWVGDPLVSAAVGLDVGPRPAQAPTIATLTAAGAANDELALSANLIHPASAGAVIDVGWSTDGGITWQAATPGPGVERFPAGGFPTSPAPGTAFAWWWNRAADFGPGASIAGALVRVTATTEGLSASADVSTGPFSTTAAPASNPSMTIDPVIDSSSAERVEITAVIADPQSAPAAVQVSYSTNGGQTWTNANGVSATQTTGLATSPDGREHLIAWTTRRDLGAQQWPDVRIRLAAGVATRMSVPFAIDLAGPAAAGPSMSGATFTALGAAIAIDFTLTDDRRLPCEITAEFMCVEHPAWAKATDAATIAYDAFAWTADSAGVAHRWIWAARRDLGVGTWHDVHVRLTASDGAQSVQADVALGDLTYAAPALTATFANVVLEDRIDAISRRVDCNLSVDAPGPVELRYSLVTAASSAPATMIGAPDVAYAAGDGLGVSVYWDAEADVPSSMDNQPQTLHVEAVRNGVTVAQQDVPAQTMVYNRGAAPVLSVDLLANSAGVVTTPVFVQFSVRDARVRAQDIAIDYSRDGGASWQEATAWPGIGNGRQSFPTNGNAANGLFAWDIERDVSERYAKNLLVQARLPNDASVAATVSKPFDIDLHVADGHTPTVSITAEDGSGPVVPLSILLYDPDGDLVNATIEAFSPIQGRWFGATAADGTDLLDAAPAQPAGTEYQFLWDAQADAAKLFPAGSQPRGQVEVRVTVKKARVASLSDTQSSKFNIDATPYDSGLRDYPDISPTTLAVTAGVPQTGVGGHELATPITLKLTDAANPPNPIADAEVQLFVAPGSALTAEIPLSVFTDDQGEAQVPVRPEPGRDGQLMLDARVVGAPACRLANTIAITVKAAKVMLPNPPTQNLVVGTEQPLYFEYGSDDPNAGLTIAYGRPEVLQIVTVALPGTTATDGRANRRIVRLGPGTFTGTYRPSFDVNVVPQGVGSVEVTVSEPGASTPLFSRSFTVVAAAKVQRRVGESSYSDAQPSLLPIGGDDPTEHVDGTRWPNRAGKEQWAWPGLTLQTPFRVKLLIDGKSDGISPAPPGITGGFSVVVDGPPPNPTFTSGCQGQGVTCAVLGTNALGGATSVDTLQVHWSTHGGILSKSTTPSLNDTSYLDANICDNVYFTPKNSDGPWSVQATVSGAVLDPGRQYWTRSYTDSSGVTHVEIHREDALQVYATWTFEIQQAPEYLVEDTSAAPEVTRIGAGVHALILARVSPSAGTSTRNIPLNAVQRNGWRLNDYTGPSQPPPFNKYDVPLTLQSSGKELRTDSFLFVRGTPETVTSSMFSFLRASWVEFGTLDGQPLIVATDPPLRQRMALADGRPSVQDALAGTTPFAGWEGTVSLADAEFVYPAAVLDVVTAYGPLSLRRTWRGHLGWERRPWLNDDEERVRGWAGAFGPGWIGSFEAECVPVPDGYRFMNPSGHVTRIRGSEPADGLRARVTRNTFINDDQAPIHLQLEGQRQWRFHADGTLREIVDARGHKTRFFYDERSRLTRIVDPHDHRIVFTSKPGTNAFGQRVDTITDSNQRSITFSYQSVALGGGVEGMLDESVGPAADVKYNGPSLSFSEAYLYEGAPPAAAGALPYGQVRLKKVFRANELRVSVEHENGRVKTQTWNGASMKFIPGTGTTRLFLVTFRDTSEQMLTFRGAGADAGAPNQIDEFEKATSSTIRTSKFRYNREGRLVRAERPDNVVERWTWDDSSPYAGVFQRGKPLAHEVVHTMQPAPAPPAPAVFRRISVWEYTDWQNPTSPTAMVPPESFARRVQRTWRTEWSYNALGEIVRTLDPAARATRITEDPGLHGPSPQPYTMEHRYWRRATLFEYNDDGLIKKLTEPDGIVTEYTYFSKADFNTGTPSFDGGGLLAEESRDTTDTGDRRFWYYNQPVATRVTTVKYDAYGRMNDTTDPRGYRHAAVLNALGLPLRMETGIAPAGVTTGQPPVVVRMEYDAHWRTSRQILEQPGGTAEQGGTELVQEVKEFDAEDRATTTSRTITTTDAFVSKLRLGTEGQVDGICRPAPSATNATEILSVDNRDERGLPLQTTAKAGRSGQPVTVDQKWDAHGAPQSTSIGNTSLQTYRGGPFGTVGGTTDPASKLSADIVAASDGGRHRYLLDVDTQTTTRAPQQPSGRFDFGEERVNAWGLTRRTQSGLNTRPAGSATAAAQPDAASDGVPGVKADWVSGVAVDRSADGFSRNSGRTVDETEYDITGRETVYQDNRTNTRQTVWSPAGVRLRERVGERDQLAWNDPLVPWRDEQWRWQPGVVWTTDVHRRLDGNGDVDQETVTLQTGTSGTRSVFASQYTYDAFGKVSSVTDPLGNTTRYTYDVHGEIATMTDANGEMNTSGTTNVDGNKATWVRDGMGRVIRIRTDLVKGGIAGPSAAPDGTSERSFSYTLDGHIKTVKDSAGFTTTWNYADHGVLESIDIPRPDSSSAARTMRQTITYDELGRPFRVSRASGLVHQTTFNSTNQVERLEVTSSSDAKAVVDFGYVNQGPARVKTLVWTRKEYTSAGYQDFRETRVIEQEIDSNGRATAETQYGTRRNLTTNTPLRTEHRVAYEYDGEGRRTALTYSDDRRFTLDLDRTGRVLGIVGDKDATVARYQILGNDFVRKRTCGDVNELRAVDGGGRLSSIEVSVGQHTIIRHAIPDHDRCGRIKTWTRHNVSPSLDEARTFTYDSAGRIVREEAAYPTVGTRTVTRKYDGDGVMVHEERIEASIAGVITARTKTSIRGGGGAIFETILNVNGTQRVVYTVYDAEGNVRADQRLMLQHDGLGRLFVVTPFFGGSSTRYSYDASNRLVACARYDDQFNEVFREDYVWDEWRLIEVWRAGQMRERYVYGQGLNEVVRAEVDGVVYVPVYGPDGSVDALIDAAGHVVESYAYDLDGVVTVFNGYRLPVSTPPKFRFGFHGHIYDPVTRLIYMRERWYSPDLAQFLENDPEPPDKSTGGYTLCAGNVVNQWDPYGKVFFLIPLLVVVLIGAVTGAGLALVRQYAEMADKTRTEIDIGQVIWGGILGAIAAPILTFAPELAVPLALWGVGNGVSEIAQGHYRTGAFDIISSLAPFGMKSVRSAVFGRGSGWNAVGRWAGGKPPYPVRGFASRISPFWVRGMPQVARYQPNPAEPVRDLVVVDDPRIEPDPLLRNAGNRQPFYRSSGENSGADRAGVWQPTDGAGDMTGTYKLSKWRFTELNDVPEEIPGRLGWGTRPNPLYRFGTALNQAISGGLGRMAIPPGEGPILTTPEALNSALASMPGTQVPFVYPWWFPLTNPFIATWIRDSQRK